MTRSAVLDGDTARPPDQMVEAGQSGLEASVEPQQSSRPSLLRRLTPRRVPFPAAIALLAVLYFGAAKLGLQAAVVYRVVSSAWPPAGLALAALLLAGVRYWPGVTIGAFLLNVSSGVPVAGAAGIGVGNTSEALVGVLLLTRVARFRPSIERLQDVLALVFLAGVLTPTVGATVGIASLWLSGAIASTAVGPLWLVWWAGDATGILVVAPVLLTWLVTPYARASAARAAEAGALGLILVMLTGALFSTPFSFVYAIFPVVGWAALRFSPRGAATATLLVSALAVRYTLHGLGPFVASTPTHNLALLQTFIALLAVTALALAALMRERDVAGRALTASEAHYRLLFDRNPIPLLVYDLKTLAFLAVNEATVRHYGYSSEEFLGMTLEDIGPPEDVTRPRELAARNQPALLQGGERRHQRKDGAILHVDITRHSVDFAGRPAALVMALDITRRKSLERQFLQAQKMEAVGRLAGGVAHDFNNLLTVIFGSSGLLLENLGSDDPHRAEVVEIQSAAHRAAALTRQLLAFSRQQLLALQVLDLSALVANLEGMLRRLIGEDIELCTVLPPALDAVEADPWQLEQVVVNLAVNARDAMPQGGKLTIEVAAAELDEYCALALPVRPGRYVMLAVSDTGLGMNADTKARIFEPFFTTKEKGKGTGFGLATVYGIVKQSGGYIWVCSEPGLGSTFKIHLPGVQALPKPLAPEPVAPTSLRGSETVLVAEDEEVVRKLIQKVLEAHGYTVLAAADGQESLRVVQDHGGVIHLLVTDVVMPGMSGRHLAEHLASARQVTKVLYLSGYTDDAILQHGVLAPGIAFLQKPFTPRALTHKVREVLDAA